MPGGTVSASGNEGFDGLVYVASVTYPTIAASASGTNTLAIPNVQNLDFVTANIQAPPAHIFLENIYVSAPGVVTLSWTTDATGISTGTIAIMFNITRGDRAPFGTSGFPTGVY
jgi:hypothetical protein